MNGIPEILEIQIKKSKKCKCNPKCQKFYKVNGIDIYCKKQLEQLAIKRIEFGNRLIKVIGKTKLREGE